MIDRLLCFLPNRLLIQKQMKGRKFLLINQVHEIVEKHSQTQKDFGGRGCVLLQCAKLQTGA